MLNPRWRTQFFLNCTETFQSKDWSRMFRAEVRTGGAAETPAPLGPMFGEITSLLRDFSPPPSVVLHAQPSCSINAIKTSAVTPPKARAQAQARTHLLPLSSSIKHKHNLLVRAQKRVRKWQICGWRRRHVGRHEGQLRAGRYAAGAEGRFSAASTASDQVATW